MNITEKNRKELVKEFKYAAKKMKETPDIRLKNYYFSATYGLMGRIKRYDFDSQLLLMEAILQAIYSNLEQTFARYAGGVVAPPPPKDNFMIPLENLVLKMAEVIEKKEDEKIYKIIEAMICFTYSYSGPGYYDQEKGLEIPMDID